MLNVWFTADFHLGHKNIIRYCNRPFDTVEEMNRTIIDRLNSLVKTNDILYFLGDFCIGPKARAGDDGVLEASDIVHLHTNADLIVLSACDTAVGRL